MDELDVDLIRPKQPNPGIKTTEFWLTLAATTIFALSQAGILGDSSVGKVAATLFATLSSLGYMTTRCKVKGGMG